MPRRRITERHLAIRLQALKMRSSIRAEIAAFLSDHFRLAISSLDIIFF